jgi:hypothetical protein
MNTELDTQNGARIRIDGVMFAEIVLGKMRGSYALEFLLILA